MNRNANLKWILAVGASWLVAWVPGLERAEAAGAKTVSTPGVVTTGKGVREALIRDPDVGGFVELFERPKQ